MQAVGSLKGGRRFLGVCLVIAVCACIFPAVASAAELFPNEFQVYDNGVEKATITADQLRQNIDVSPNWSVVEEGFFFLEKVETSPENFVTREVRGTLATRPRPGASLSEVAFLAGVDPASLSGSQAVVIKTGDGTKSVTLSRADVLEGIPNILEPNVPPGFAVLWAEDENIRLTVPVRSREEEFGWNAKQIEGSGAHALKVELTTGGENLSVEASCSKGKVGEPVQCKATPKTGSDAEWVYNWDFGDETADRTGPEPEHTYTQAGTYAVNLTVVSPSGTGAKQLKVEVEAQKNVGPEGDEGNQESKAGPKGKGGSGSDQAAAVNATEASGTGAAPPDSVSNGPDQSHAHRDSKGGKHHRRRQRGSESDAVIPGSGNGHGPGAGSGTGTGAGGGSERGASEGLGAAGVSTTGTILDRHLSDPGPVSQPSSAAEDTSSGHSRRRSDGAGQAGREVVEGRLLTAYSYEVEPVGAAHSSSHPNQRLQQAASGGEGERGSTLGPVIAAMALLLALGSGGAIEWISSGRRRTRILEAQP